MSLVLRFRPVPRPSGPLYEAAIRIYEDSFPSNERQTLQTVSTRIGRGQSRLWVAESGGDVIGMALLWEVAALPWRLLDYLAIREDWRGQGAGGLLMRFLVDACVAEHRRLVMEVERPQAGSIGAARQRRIRFYLAHGAGVLRDVPYWLPALDGTVPTEMLLMIAPARDGEVLDGHEIVQLIMRLYAEVYGRGGDDALLQSFVHRVPESVEVARRWP